MTEQEIPNLKTDLIQIAKNKGYKIVALMLQTQSEETLAIDIRVALERLSQISLDNLKLEIVQELQDKFKFNLPLSTKFADVICEYCYGRQQK
jgi:bifunctional N-acetylglucosamine-1-phosphate-uridyltransferase/glucosamine-1-phosphate-acetyltransferase GlmU-like protein